MTTCHIAAGASPLRWCSPTGGWRARQNGQARAGKQEESPGGRRSSTPRTVRPPATGPTNTKPIPQLGSGRRTDCLPLWSLGYRSARGWIRNYRNEYIRSPPISGASSRPLRPATGTSPLAVMSLCLTNRIRCTTSSTSIHDWRGRPVHPAAGAGRDFSHHLGAWLEPHLRLLGIQHGTLTIILLAPARVMSP